MGPCFIPGIFMPSILFCLVSLLAISVHTHDITPVSMNVSILCENEVGMSFAMVTNAYVSPRKDSKCAAEPGPRVLRAA
ncbi:hypothetical protein BJ138DRAFT_1164865 [Hygrophoropsis aurantiaca]|uniref:Uncharacterized protein n=1 Tax=Hygrophoropsis aurantiaca TaxID=72124 RepID=A0ACB7ZXE5_9AGAM|nr:hypothetical protein BJ138DRAFT_1164865 [Hygrophoropsis aurantiaca]